MTITRYAHHDLEDRVMMRVKYIHLMRKFASPLVVESALVLAALFVCQFWVSFDKLSANALTVATTWSFKAYLSYFFASLANTELIVQAMMSVAFISLALYFGKLLKVKNVFRVVRPAMRFVGI